MFTVWLKMKEYESVEIKNMLQNIYGSNVIENWYWGKWKAVWLLVKISFYKGLHFLVWICIQQHIISLTHVEQFWNDDNANKYQRKWSCVKWITQQSLEKSTLAFICYLIEFQTIILVLYPTYVHLNPKSFSFFHSVIIHHIEYFHSFTKVILIIWFIC